MLSQKKLNQMKGNIKKKLAERLHIETNGVSVTARKKACCICDTQLDHRNGATISLERLRKKTWLLLSSISPSLLSTPSQSSTATRQFFKNEYCIPAERSEALSSSEKITLSKLILSPRSVITREKKSLMISVCRTCVAAKNPPKLSIPNLPIGKEPDIVASLNDTELALISMGRVSGHIFHMFGGAHSSIKTWHQVHVNNIEHLVGNLNLLDAANVKPNILCILSGPFTPRQKALAKKRIAIDRRKVIEAYEWLAKNNIHYSDVVIPQIDELQMPTVVDHTEDEEPGNTPQSNLIERTEETTVFFPELGDIEQSRREYRNKEEFLQHVLASGRSDTLTLVSQSTKEALKTWKPDDFVKAFPRQFPYGYGGRPDGVSSDDYIKHLMKLSNNMFQRADFILVSANLHFKEAMVKNASIRCKYMSGNQTAVERFNDIDTDEIDYYLENPSMLEDVPTSNLSYFVRSVFAISKCLPFSDEAIKSERLKLFSLCSKFGLPTGLLTVTPDDSDNFHLYVHKNENVDFVSKMYNLDSVKEYLSECNDIRVNLPGYAEAEFETIIDIVISDILGWDQKSGASNPEGGKFGNLNAWFLAVEEQGRKTLHGHFLIWVKDWDKLLKSIYNKNSNDEEAAQSVCKMKAFMDANVSTSCFDIKIPITRSDSNSREYYPASDLGLRHVCNNVHPRYEYPADQQVRNMRFRHCCNSPNHLQIATCVNCNRVFTLNDVIENSLSFILTEKLNLEAERDQHNLMLKYVISICQSGISNLEEAVDTLPIALKRFLLHLHRNLHKQRHSQTCFKKGSECRLRLPAKANTRTKFEFLDQHTTAWYEWSGVKKDRDPFRLIPERQPLDIFTNSHNAFISELFHCNSNFQCCIDGSGIFYITTYTCKSTRLEDKQDQFVSLVFLKRFMDKAQGRTGVLGEEGGLPDKEAFRRIFASAMAASSNYTLSAPMAKYLVLHGSRFRCSHSFTGVPFWDFMNGRSTFAKLEVSLRNTVFLSSRRDTYLFRPDHLNHLDPVSLYSKYQVRQNRGRTCSEAEFFRFQQRAPPGYRNLGLVEVDNATIPLIYYNMFTNASALDQDITNPAVETSAIVEEHCKKIMLLFCHYRLEEDILVEPTYKMSLISKISSEEINPDFSTYLQHIQNCRNSLDTPRIPDILEETTISLEEPIGNTKKKQSKQTPDEVLAHINQNLSDVVAEISDVFLQNSSTNTSTFDLSKLTSEGAHHIGHDKGLLPTPVQTSNESVFTEDSDGPLKRSMQSDGEDYFPSPKITQQTLLTLIKTSIYRCTNLSDIDRANINNILPTGSKSSITAWAEAAFGQDIDQKAAFKSLISDFVLQYLEEVYAPHTLATEDSMLIRRWRNELRGMRGLDEKDKHNRVIMFLTGPGGSGKSHVIHNIIEYAKQFTIGLDQPFTSRTIVVTALTGVAATSILGETLHSAACISVNHRPSTKLYGNNANDIINSWKETKLLIVDEISFANKTLLQSLAVCLERLKENREKHYGGISVLFAGDFSQLEPISGTCLYKRDNRGGSLLNEWHVWVNAFVQLKGGHRFTDERYKSILTDLRDSGLKLPDYAILNQRVLDNHDLSAIPPGTQIACADNKDRCAMNNLAFLGHLQATHILGGQPQNHTMIVKMSGITWVSNNKGMSLGAMHTLFEEVGDYKMKRGDDRFMDPFLKLYTGAPVMLTENQDVASGIANGTIGTIKKIIIKEGCLEHIEVINIDGYNVNAIDASSVKRIVIDIQLPDRSHREISQEPILTKTQVDMPFDCLSGRIENATVKIKGTQFTFLVNHATTVHKLQGRTVDNLYIVNWSYKRNWVYVALSRVRSLRGLYLRQPLDPLKNLRPYSELLQMLADFESTKSLKFHMQDFIMM